MCTCILCFFIAIYCTRTWPVVFQLIVFEMRFVHCTWCIFFLSILCFESTQIINKVLQSPFNKHYSYSRVSITRILREVKINSTYMYFSSYKYCIDIFFKYCGGDIDCRIGIVDYNKLLLVVSSDKRSKEVKINLSRVHIYSQIHIFLKTCSRDSSAFLTFA